MTEDMMLRVLVVIAVVVVADWIRTWWLDGDE